MLTPGRELRSHLFTLRMWSEDASEGRVEWRGKLQHVVDGETFYFRGWDSMVALLRGILERPDGGSVDGPPFAKAGLIAGHEPTIIQVSAEADTEGDQPKEKERQI